MGPGSKILKCALVGGDGNAGKILSDDLAVACGLGAVQFTMLQREGKGIVDAATFLRGFPVHMGTRLS